MLQALTLDLDDTLWPVMPAIEAAERAVQDWLETHCPEAARDWSLEGMRKLRDSIQLRYPDLQHDYTALRQIALREVLAPYGHGEREVMTAFEVFYAARNAVQLYPEAGDALERLARRLPLVAVSNGNACLRRIGLSGLFRAQIHAREFGQAKPQPGIFLAACRAARSEPARTLHIGDHPEQDVRGAIGAGLQAAWINRQRLPWPLTSPAPAQFACLAELADHVEGMTPR